MAQIVYTDVAGDSSLRGSLFQGTKFWFSHRLPSRALFIEQVKVCGLPVVGVAWKLITAWRLQANGGEVVPLEKFADVKIVDHVRKDNAPGTHSYQYIERSVRNGVLEDLDDHRAGTSTTTARPVGAIWQPSKSTKVPFSAEDDRILGEWVGEQAQKGQATSGNEIFKQLWQKNQRHPWQSWRDRWVKYLRPAQVPDNAPPTPPNDQAEVNTTQPALAPALHVPGTAFTGEDAKALLATAEDIHNVHPSQRAESWHAWAELNPHHSAQEWQNFWEANIRPVYLKKLAKDGKKVERPAASASNEEVDEAPLHKGSSRALESPNVLSRSPLQERVIHKTSPEKAKVVHTAMASTSGDESIDLPTVRVPEISNRTPKRKLAATENEYPTSSPPNYSRSSAIKRQRVEREVSRPTEIPSTPERTPLGERRITPIVVKHEIIDLEEDEEEVEDDFSEEEEDEEYDEVDLPGRAPSQSLSEPDDLRTKSWHTSKGPRRRLDFDLPPPIGGWDDEGDSDSLQGPEIGSTRPGRQDTQALLRETPLLDFTVAEPNEGWDAFLEPPPSSPPAPLSQSSSDEDDSSSTPEGPMTEKEIIAKLEAWFDSCIDIGIDVDIIELALKAASNNPDLADVVLDSLGKGRGVPDNISGIWTEEDDECLEAVDARRIDRVIEKHGVEALDRRYEFLRLYNEGE